MRKHAREMETGTSTRTRRVQITAAAAIVIVFALAATAISMQASKGENPSEQTTKLSAGSNSGGHSVPLRATQDGQFSQAQIRPLTQAEAQQMADGLKTLVNQSTEGLREVHHADGSVSMDLQGRFQSVALAKKAENGYVAQSCVDNPESAAAFFGINRELIDGVKSKTRQSLNRIESGESGKGQKR